MPRVSANDLAAVAMVAKEQSFSKAAANLGVTPSALSHLIKGIEQKLGVVLFDRTTRTVTPTDAGRRLAQSIIPLFDRLYDELELVAEPRDRPHGTVRLICDDDNAAHFLRQPLAEFARLYPDIRIELVAANHQPHSGKDNFDAIIGSHQIIRKGMVSTVVGADWRFAVVVSPAYLQLCSTEPVTPMDLLAHRCINRRITDKEAPRPWLFTQGGEEVSVEVDAHMTFDSTLPILNAAIDGIGFAHLPETLVRPYLERGELVEILRDWSEARQGYYMSYAENRSSSPALSLFISVLKQR